MALLEYLIFDGDKVGEVCAHDGDAKVEEEQDDARREAVRVDE